MEDDKAIIGSPAGVGAQLRVAREAKGLTLEQVAAETRIPQRHLTAMEAGDFGKLPGRTYAVGFARTYARAIGLDQDAIAGQVRADLDAQSDDGYRPVGFEPGDPARVPSRALGWFAGFAVLLLLAGGFFFFRSIFSPAGELPSLVQQQQAQQKAQQAAAPRKASAAAPAATPAGPVVFTALQPGIWVKFYDAAGKQLLQKQLAQGESFTVPADAPGPMLWTGRPDALGITVGGKALPKLAEKEQVMKDVPVTAAALLARGQPSPAPTAAPSAAPTGEKPAPSAT